MSSMIVQVILQILSKHNKIGQNAGGDIGFSHKSNIRFIYLNAPDSVFDKNIDHIFDANDPESLAKLENYLVNLHD